ncbi:MAG: caspase family protein [Alphaproteobacteria bacterium]
MRRKAAWLIFLVLGLQVLTGCSDLSIGRVFRADGNVLDPVLLQRASLVAVDPGTPLSSRGAVSATLQKLGYNVSFAFPDRSAAREMKNALALSCRDLGVTRRGGGNTATVQCRIYALSDNTPVYHGEGEYMDRCLGCTVAGTIVREDWEGATRAALAKLPRAGTLAPPPGAPPSGPVLAEEPPEPPDPNRIRGVVRPRAVALVVGVEDYRRVPRADYAANDARRFQEFARTTLGITRVKLLEGAETDRTSLLRALRLWAKGEITPGESDVTVFFAGHGLSTPDGSQLYLLPSDGAPDMLAETALRRSDIISALAAAGARSITLFLDTCYSGQVRNGETLLAGLRPVLVRARVEEQAPEGVTVLSAAAADQLSGAFPEQKHGLFSYFLMQGLSGKADRNGDRRITTGELHAYVVEAVSRQAARQGRTQEPQLQGDPERVLVQW